MGATTQENEKLYPRRWSILAALFIALLALQYTFIAPSGAALLVMMQYNATPMMFSIVMTIPFLSGILFGFFAGVLGDRIGTNRVILIGFAIALIGAIWRCFSGSSYISLFLSSFVIGFATAALNANSAKIIRLWFPGKSNAAAMGVYVAGATLGGSMAIMIGGHIATVDIVWWSSVGLIVVAIICWVVLYRPHPDGEGEVEEAVGKHMGIVLKNIHVWGISIFAFLFMGITSVNTSFSVAGFTLMAGAETAAEASTLSSIQALVCCVATIVLPATLARFKRLRAPLTALIVCCAVTYVLPWFLPWGAATWVLWMLQGILMGPIMAMSKTLPALLPGIKREHLGAVGGIQSVFQNFGMFFVASYLLAPIATAIDPTGSLLFYRAIYIGTGIIIVLSAVSLLMFPNVRTNVADKIKDDMAAARAALGNEPEAGSTIGTASETEEVSGETPQNE